MYYKPHERFNNARTEYNINGKETMAQVAKATGVPQSAISDLERDPNIDADHTTAPRKVAYQTVAILAKHYGVSADYLLGLSDDPKRIPGAIDELGLSPEAIEGIKRIGRIAAKNRDYGNPATGHSVEILDSFLINFDFVFILSRVASAKQLVEATISDYNRYLEDAPDLEPDEALDWVDYILDPEKYQFARFQAMQRFSEMIDKICGFEELKEAEKRLNAMIQQLEEKIQDGINQKE